MNEIQELGYKGYLYFNRIKQGAVMIRFYNEDKKLEQDMIWFIFKEFDL